MNERRWSYRVVLRYSLFQVPGTVLLVLILLMLHWWTDIPMWSLWTIVILWIAMDVVMFPLVWRSYDTSLEGNVNSLIGSHGRAVEHLSPTGYIRVRGELWRAEVVNGSPPINEGENIQVRGSRGLTLLVQHHDEQIH